MTATTDTIKIIRINEKMVRDLEDAAGQTVDYAVYRGICGLLAGARELLARARADHIATLALGDKVTTSGFPGKIVAFIDGMIQVRLDRGEVVVTAQDVELN